MYLNCHTYYSFRYGTISIDDLFKLAEENNCHQFVLTDINNTSGCIEYIRKCKEQGKKPIVGIDFRNGIDQQFVGIAQNNDGFEELNRFLSKHQHDKIDIPPIAPAFNNSYIIYPYSNTPHRKLRENEYIGVAPWELKNFAFSKWRHEKDHIVALQPVSFRSKREYSAHRLLRAIDKNTLLSKLEKEEQAQYRELMIPEYQLKQLYHNYPDIIRNTENILTTSGIDFEMRMPKNKTSFTGSKQGDHFLLSSLCEEGLYQRFGNRNEAVIERMNKEMELIKDLGFASYFLINWDLVRYAQHKDYFYVGRGSGANSMVAYLLRITDVDPLELDLYFERFINPFRTSPPDFDIDFSWTDRDDITNYIFERHSYEKTVLLGSYNTFQFKSVIRELGKVFGLPSKEIVKVQKAKDQSELDQLSRLVLQYGQLIHGFPSHLSIHSSGILISEKPIYHYTGTFMPPKNFPTTQFSMLEAEDIGLHKYDILSQRGLSKIKDSITIVNHNQPNNNMLDIHDIPKLKQDTRIKELLKNGNAIGCFYVESPAMRMLMKKLRADDYIRLVAASSIIRPGVAKSGMMREYILRYRKKSERERAKRERPVIWDILEETYGVMVYQEDVIKVAHYYAGLTLAESDVLRRGMSWKFRERNEFNTVKDKFFFNCARKGHDPVVTEDVWRQIESFANYAFSKGHSASYAVESFQALYLKAYFPLEYITATLNNGGGFYRYEFYVHEARMHGAIIEAPCINKSGILARIFNKSIYIGLGRVHELEVDNIKSILEERNLRGPFKSLEEFLLRMDVSLEQMILLIRVGAFRFTKKSKQELLWEIHFILGKAKKRDMSKKLFTPEVKHFELPELDKATYEDAFDEMELLGFPLSSPFDLMADQVECKTLAEDLPKYLNKKVEILGYLVTIKHTSTSDKKRMHFGTFVDRKGHWIDTVHFPPSAEAYPFRGPGCYLLKGRVAEEFDFLSIEVDEMKHLGLVNKDEIEAQKAQRAF